MHKAKKNYCEFIEIDKSLRIYMKTKKAHGSEPFYYLRFQKLIFSFPRNT